MQFWIHIVSLLPLHPRGKRVFSQFFEYRARLDLSPGSGGPNSLSRYHLFEGSTPAIVLHISRNCPQTVVDPPASFRFSAMVSDFD